MIRCLRTTCSARSRPIAVRIASLCSPRSTSPSASSRFSISPAEARETPSISATRDGERGRAGRSDRPVLADREGEEVDRLEVVVDRVPRHLRSSSRSCSIARCKVSLTTMSTTQTLLLGAIAGLTIFVGLPMGRFPSTRRRPSGRRSARSRPGSCSSCSGTCSRTASRRSQTRLEAHSLGRLRRLRGAARRRLRRRPA